MLNKFAWIASYSYLFFITLTAVSGGILNTFGRFAIPAVTPCLLNLSMIASCVFLLPVLFGRHPMLRIPR